MTDVVPGLREQKRIATRRALQVALLRLSLERGFDAVTIDEVAQAAQVSTRTFFNYFASKEEAVGGPSAPLELSAEDRRRYEDGGADPLADLLHVFAARPGQPDETDLELHRLRRRLMQQEARLLGDKVASAQRFHEQVVAMVAERLRADALRSGVMPDEAVLTRRASLTAGLGVALAREGWHRWADAGGGGPLSTVLEDVLADFRVVAAG